MINPCFIHCPIPRENSYFSNTSTEIFVFQACFGEWKLRISGECRKLVKIARKRGGTSLRSHNNSRKSCSNGLKSYSNGLKSKHGPLLSIQIQMQLSIVWTNSTQQNRKLCIFFLLNGLENTTLFNRVIGKSTVFDTSWIIYYCFTSGENEQLPMSVKFATRAEGQCCNHTSWQSLVPHEWNTLCFSTCLVSIVLSPLVLRRKMAIFTIRVENSNICQISHFTVSKQTVKVQFSLDVLGNSYLFYW